MNISNDKENQSFYSNCSTDQSIDIEDILKPQLLLTSNSYFHIHNYHHFLDHNQIAHFQQQKDLKLNSFNNFILQAINFNFLPLLAYAPSTQSIQQITIKNQKNINEMLKSISLDKIFYFSAKITTSRSYYGFIDCLYITTSTKEYVISFQRLNQFRQQIDTLFSDRNILKCAYQNQNTIWLLYYYYNIITLNYLDLSTLPKSQFDNSIYNSMWIKLIELIKSYPQGVLNMNIIQNAEILKNRIFNKQPESIQPQEDILKLNCSNHQLLHKIIIWRKKVAQQEDEDENFILTNSSLVNLVKNQEFLNVKEKYKDSLHYLMNQKPDPSKQGIRVIYLFRLVIQKNNLKLNLNLVKEKLIYEEFDFNNGGSKQQIQYSLDFQNQSILEGMKQHLEQAVQFEQLEIPIKLETLLQNNQLTSKQLHKLKLCKNSEVIILLYHRFVQSLEDEALKFAKGVMKIVNARTDRKQSARLCDTLIDQVQQFDRINRDSDEEDLEYHLNNLDFEQVDFKPLPQSFDEYIQNLIPIKQTQAKKKKKQKIEDFNQQDMKQLESFLSTL